MTAQNASCSSEGSHAFFAQDGTLLNADGFGAPFNCRWTTGDQQQ
jgi:hypothetical protein